MVQQQTSHLPTRVDRATVRVLLPQHYCRWYLTLSFSLITSSTNGYDGSLMNSFQSLKLWNDYFGRPHGSMLGLLNAIQVS